MTEPRRIRNCVDAALQVLSKNPSALISDVDGTISRIVPDPGRASVSNDVLDSLAKLVASLDTVALISGRQVADLRRMVPVPGLFLVGVHGMEWGRDSGSTYDPEVSPFAPQMAEAERWIVQAKPGDGVIVENKGVSLTIHFRGATDRAGTRFRILELLSQCPEVRGLRLAEARMGIELLPPVLIDKGDAVRRLAASRELAGALYLGDDMTDLDAMRELRHLRENGTCESVAIWVQNDEISSSPGHDPDLVLGGVGEVGHFLSAVATALARR